MREGYKGVGCFITKVHIHLDHWWLPRLTEAMARGNLNGVTGVKVVQELFLSLEYLQRFHLEPGFRLSEEFALLFRFCLLLP